MSNTEFDPIQKAAHYNLHPSGIECISLIEWMPANLANAWKYLHRQGKKESALQDLKKALYYTTREARRLRIVARSKAFVLPYYPGRLSTDFKKYLKFESGLRRELFTHLWAGYRNGDVQALSQAELVLGVLIREQEASA